MSKLPDIGLDDLLRRTEEDGDCLLWTCHANAGKYPQWRVGGEFWAVRRLIWELTRGPIRKGYQIGVRCGTLLCVHPDCLTCRTRGQATPDHLKPDVRMRIATSRRAHSKLTMDMVRAIRASDDPGRVVEQRYGLKAGYASRIRTGRVWVDHSNPFAGMGARP